MIKSKYLTTSFDRKILGSNEKCIIGNCFDDPHLLVECVSLQLGACVDVSFRHIHRKVGEVRNETLLIISNLHLLNRDFIIAGRHVRQKKSRRC